MEKGRKSEVPEGFAKAESSEERPAEPASAEQVRQENLDFNDVRFSNVGRSMTMDDNGSLSGFRLTYAVLVKRELVGFVDCEFKPRGKGSCYLQGLSKLVHARIKRGPVQISKPEQGKGEA